MDVDVDVGGGRTKMTPPFEGIGESQHGACLFDKGHAYQEGASGQWPSFLLSLSISSIKSMHSERAYKLRECTCK